MCINVAGCYHPQQLGQKDGDGMVGLQRLLHSALPGLSQMLDTIWASGGEVGKH